MSVAAVPPEAILRQQARAVMNVWQEQSHRLQAAVSAELASPERMQSRGKSVTHAHEAKFRLQAVKLAAHVLPGFSPKMVWCVKDVRTELFL